MTMNCKSAKTRIALWAGNDLEAAGKREVKAHLADCQPCREYWQEMKVSMQALHAPANAPTGAEQPSLWPKISSRLPKRVRKPRQTRFNGWAAAASVAAACMVLVAYAVNYPYQPHGPIDYAVPSQMLMPSPVDYSPERPAPKKDLNRLLEEQFYGPNDQRKARDNDNESLFHAIRR